MDWIMDPKVLNKQELYGKFDESTGSFTDGVLTKAVRNILELIREWKGNLSNPEVEECDKDRNPR